MFLVFTAKKQYNFNVYEGQNRQRRLLSVITKETYGFSCYVQRYYMKMRRIGGPVSFQNV